jgi:hypothetical protein
MVSLIFTLWMAFWQADSTESAKLQKLIGERDQLHAQWKSSESQKTGIFGNRTKKDMIETNEWLGRIVDKDNQIMDELRMLGSIEKATITQEKEDYKSISMKLARDVQILQRSLAEKDAEIEEKISQRRTIEWITFFLFLTSVGLGWWIYRIKKAS